MQLETDAQSRAKPPTSTVAVTVEPSDKSLVLTSIVEVPCPDSIDPAETVQLNVGVTFESPPRTSAVICSFSFM